MGERIQIFLMIWIIAVFSPISLSQPVDINGSAFTQPELVGMSSEKLSKLNDIIQRHVDNESVQGAVVAVSRHEKTVFLEARGFSDLNTKTPINPDALFHLASATKPILGVAAMIAIERGLIKPFDLSLIHI